MKKILLPIFLLLFLVGNSFAGKRERNSLAVSDSLKNPRVNEDSSSFSIPDGLTAQKIIENYLNAIGGTNKLEKVFDRTTIMKSKVNDKYLTIKIYQKVPDMMRQIIDLGAFKQNVYFKGVKGIMVVAGKAVDVKGSELEKLKYESMLHFLIRLDSLGVNLQLQGTATVNGKETYQVALVLPSGAKWIENFDPKTWLKVKETKDVVVPQGKFIQETYYSDYRDVDGIKYPFEVEQKLGMQQIKFKVESIKVNSGLNSDLFKQN